MDSLENISCPIWFREFSQNVDQLTIENNKISAEELMENAGHQIAEFSLFQTRPRQKIVVLCGKGNNGGDGYVSAFYLQQFCREVICLDVALGEVRSVLCQKNFDRCQKIIFLFLNIKKTLFLS